MEIRIIVAASENNVIGVEGKIPWNIPGELAHFKKQTMGHPIIMGRTTHESIGGALPGRTNIVLSKNPIWLMNQKDDITVVESKDKALAVARASEGNDVVYIIGGQQIYELFLPEVDVVELSRVHLEIENGNAFFPELDPAQWKRTREEEFAKNCTIQTFQRIGK